MKDLSLTCHLKLFWRFLNSDSLWARWMSAKYRKNNNFWTTLPKGNHSNVWKQILKCRDIGKTFLERKSKLGEETSLWFDPWFNSDSFINKVVEVPMQKCLTLLKIISGNLSFVQYQPT